MSGVKVCPTCGTEYPASERFCPRDGAALRSADAHADLVGQVVAERYHVLKKLGEGGMGQVYLAEHVRMGRQSAVKVMSPALARDADAVSRFNREAANASRITHPNVAAIYDFGETTDGLIYLAMEFIDGEPLTALVKRLGALPIPRAIDIARQTADALTVAHELGIVHRDLKPDNIMIGHGREGADLVKVVDFGIAKASQNEAQKVTKTGLVVGTPEYMSPEQLAGDKLDGRSDIYSLGLVTFVMLTGSLPFAGDSAQEAMLARLMEKPKTLAEVRPDITWPPGLQPVMDKVLARDQTLRYTVAGEFGAELMRSIKRGGTPPAPVTAQRTVAMDMSAIPATRVAPATERPPREAPSAPSAPAAVAETPAPRRTGLFIGMAAVVVIIAGGATAMVMSRGGATPTTPPRSQRTDSLRPDSSNTPPVVVARDTTRPTDTAVGSTTGHKPPKLKPPTTPVGQPGDDPSARYKRLETLTDDQHQDQPSARQALDLANGLIPQLTANREEHAGAEFMKVQALGVLQKQDEACDLLRTIRDRGDATGTRWEKSISPAVAACQ